MKVIYLVDYIGVHCGMHYYLEAFKQILSKIPNVKIKILSNYSDQTDINPFFCNQYKGCIINKGYALFSNLSKLLKFVRQNKEAIFIYLTYGNWIDILFIKCISIIPNHIIDIHEVIAQDVDSNKFLKKLFQSLYKNCIKNVISHSERSNDFLKEFEFNGNKLNVPHFKYVFSIDYEKSLIPSEILDAPDIDRINFLFFGNINVNKGIDILLQAFNELAPNIANRVNLIIAGKDFDGTIDKVRVNKDRHVKIFKRHISDDELRFLYQNIDYIVLPYRKTSQSGILEMAFYFKKPIIASNIPYFKEMLSLFPSFGLLVGNGTKSFAEAIERVVNNGNKKCYYNATDYDKYTNRNEINKFIYDISEWINNTKY